MEASVQTSTNGLEGMRHKVRIQCKEAPHTLLKGFCHSARPPRLPPGGYNSGQSSRNFLHSKQGRRSSTGILA